MRLTILRRTATRLSNLPPRALFGASLGQVRHTFAHSTEEIKRMEYLFGHDNGCGRLRIPAAHCRDSTDEPTVIGCWGPSIRPLRRIFASRLLRSAILNRKRWIGFMRLFVTRLHIHACLSPLGYRRIHRETFLVCLGSPSN